MPQNDPTLLFANAGMNQFKDVFLGREKRGLQRGRPRPRSASARAASTTTSRTWATPRATTRSSRCSGNFSFGDYFKKDAIAFAWEFLTRDMGLAKDRLTVTIFKGESGVPRDAEAHGFWLAHVPADRILELGAKDNFWAMGDTGPCGPCSEIHFFQGDSLPCAEVEAGRDCLGVECECDRWLEVWNLVFMQYDRDAAGTLNPLPAPCIDTGMGLERITSVVQGKLIELRHRPLPAAHPGHRGAARASTYGADADEGRLAARGGRPPARDDVPDRRRRDARQRGPRLRPAQDHAARAAPRHASWASRARS